MLNENNKRNRSEQHTAQLTLSFILHVCASGVAPSILSRCLFFIKHNGSCQSIISPSSSSPPLSSSSGSSKDMFVVDITPSHNCFSRIYQELIQLESVGLQFTETSRKHARHEKMSYITSFFDVYECWSPVWTII